MRKLLTTALIFFCRLYAGSQALYGFNQNSYPAYDNEAFVDSIVALRPEIIRHPEGKGTNFSDWKTERPTLPALAGMRKKVGCEILFVLNMNTSTLSYEMEMLDSASKLGIPILYIEFGNEVNNDNSPLRKKFHSSGAQYGDTCKLWATAIKLKYPKAKFGAWGENKDDLPTWNKDLLSVYKPDAVISHLYPDETTISKNGIIDKAYFSHWLEHSFERSGINFKTPVWVTEYNLNPDGLKYLKKGQHKEGLIFMSQKLDSMGVQMLIMHSLSQGENGAFEIHTNGSVKMRVTGKAMAYLKSRKQFKPTNEQFFSFNYYPSLQH